MRSPQSLELRKGMRAPEAYAWLVGRLPQIETVATIPYKQPPEAADRTHLDQMQRELLVRARGLRVRLGLPFWDAVALLTLTSEVVDAGALIEACSYHQPHSVVRSQLTRDQVVGGELAEGRLDLAAPFGVLSEVQLADGERCHIPMLDFRVPVGDRALALLSRIGLRLLPSGFLLLDSGRSYHLIGITLMSTAAFTRFLGEALLYGPIVDRHYVGHQLMEGTAMLRVSNLGSVGPPELVYWYFPENGSADGA